MASLADMLTTAKNIVTALNQLGQTYLQVQGTQQINGITTPTLVQSGQGRLCRVIVTVAGSGDGAIYDAASSSLTTGKVFLVPKDHGIYEVNLPINNGIVVAPGSGQTISVSYS
jgi:hypothetical protein